MLKEFGVKGRRIGSSGVSLNSVHWDECNDIYIKGVRSKGPEIWRPSLVFGNYPFSQSSIFLVDYVFQIIGTIVRIDLIAFNDRTQRLSQPDIRLSLNLQIWCFFTSLVHILWHPFDSYLHFNCKLKYIFFIIKVGSWIRDLLNLILCTGHQEFDRRTHPLRHFVQKNVFTNSCHNWIFGYV
jgi:hypothetical protein